MKKKIFLLATIVLLFTTAYPLYASSNFQPKGHIQNDRGQNCNYSQITDHSSKYFYEKLTGRAGTITFDDPTCMAESAIGLDGNKMMINNIISRWYSHRDAAFQTRVHELYPGSPMQKRGYCIQSKKYPAIGITVEYEIKNGAIVRVIHGSSVLGCSK